MTQLELPPVSFARYLDLLKRRRWQVLPISLLGLLIGALVAFLVPRYYVVHTTIKFDGHILDTQPGDDPMAELVDSGKIRIPLMTQTVLRTLGWPEAFSGSPDQQRAFEKGVRDRIRVTDLGPPQRSRKTALVQIAYKDQDGERAVEFVHGLRDAWIDKNHRELEAKADREEARLNDELGKAARAVDAAEEALRRFERANKLNPQDLIQDRNRTQSELSRGLEAARAELDDVVDQLAQARKLQAKAEEKIAVEKPKRRKSVNAASIPTVLRSEYLKLEAKVRMAQLALQAVTEAHPNHKTYQRALEVAQEEQVRLLRVIQEVQGESIEEFEDNPKYAALRKELDTLEIEIAGLTRTEARLREKIAADDELVEKMPGLLKDHRELTARAEKARLDREALEQQVRDFEAKRRGLASARAYDVLQDAWVPPRPTDPDITLLALAGSAVGLAIAIGLILLLDVLQSNFKTLADVEHALPVPVLGGISHMVSHEEQVRVAARRTRVGLVAGAFLLLMISVVTIYYVAPTRLPNVVRDALGVLLGAPE